PNRASTATLRSVLVANRGEIALRIVRTCHDLDIRAVAVYSDVDRNALHVRAADAAYPIGPAAPRESYLNAARLIEVAKRSGCEEDLDAAWRGATGEAATAFGQAALYLEQAIIPARHVEMQILADGHGSVVWLGERDCSVQRRHQKLIEETPGPWVDDRLREQLGEAAVRIAKKAGYRNAGTVEFLVDHGG